ncbi:MULTISPECIES: hypothetical protein [Methyloceanibacter]|uniref:hypothetical protein n=1 Tax=Methyloceanibacter TaxID=1484898 RepID=UPI0012DFFC7F|nr:MULTISPECIES: hypothetical protein [Methyloceanibacter]
MKRLCIGGMSCLLLFSPTPVSALDEATDDLTSIFEYVCLDTLPFFDGAEPRLRQMGFELTAFGDNEFEGRHASQGLTANLAAGKREHANPGCTIQSKTAVYDRAEAVALEMFNNVFGGNVTQWRYNGKPAGWKAALSEGSVYLSVTGEGVDVPSGVGISLELRSE